MRLSPACAAALAIVAASAPALANGRFPAAGQAVVDPKDPAHLVVRSTYGVLSSRDAGATWGWICEEALGMSGNEDPSVAIASGGGLVVGLFEGLAVARDGGCAWSIVPATKDKYVIDVSASRAAPEDVIALASNGTGASSFVTQVYRSKDGGASWSQLGADLPASLLGLTLDAAPSASARLYVSGVVAAPENVGALFRSDDGGATWSKQPIPGTDGTHLPYIAAIDPKSPDTVFVRVSTGGDDVALVTRDGGASFTTFHTAKGSLLAFAIAPDGSEVLLGGDKDGLWRGPTTTLALEQVASIRARCLAWADDAVYACGDEFADGFTLGRSKDRGQTFTAAMHLGGVCGPLGCPAGTTVATTCPDRWPVTQEIIGATGCGGGGGASADAGAGGSAATTTTSTTTATAAPASGGSSGGCALGGAGPRGRLGLGAAGAIGLAALAALGRRRRRARRA
jgi:hypothetical protein